jgi:hypothetical protein
MMKPREENVCHCQTSKNNELLHRPAETKYNNHSRQSRLILRSRIFMRVHMTYKRRRTCPQMQLLPDLNNQITGCQFLTQGYHHTSTEPEPRVLKIVPRGHIGTTRAHSCVYPGQQHYTCTSEASSCSDAERGTALRSIMCGPSACT